MTHERNDVHSQLNPTIVARIERPETLAELREAIATARARGLRISVAGGRHAMGGQQFAAGSLHIDTTGLTRVLRADAASGLLHIEAGADWPCIMDATRAVATASGAAGASARSRPGSTRSRWADRFPPTPTAAVC